MPQPLTDPRALLVFGPSAEDVHAHLAQELDHLDAHLRTRQADWTVAPPGRAWSPAQELEHVMSINDAGSRAIRLLLSERELRPVPQVPGVLQGGKRQAPPFAQPSGQGLPFSALGGVWAEHRAELLALAAQVSAHPARQLWHPFLGELDALGWLRSLVAHLRHHRELLEGVRA